ncbi:unnamed protein product [Effrenium voratum]|nr:unnamed protein product [Effrenium voratum]
MSAAPFERPGSAGPWPLEGVAMGVPKAPKLPPPAHSHEAAVQGLISRGLPISDVLDVVLTPRPSTAPGGSAPATPRPVMRGPRAQAGTWKELTPQEEKTIDAAFKKFDKYHSGKLEIHSFFDMCRSLDLHLNAKVAREWLGQLNKVDGLTLDQVKSICTSILAAQTPAVRSCTAGKALGLFDLQASEEYMRAAFKKFAPKGTVSAEGLRELLRSLDFPDVHCDHFDRYVGEWLLIVGKDDEAPINVHEFISCVNLLVDVCQRHQEALENELEK